MKLKIIQFGEEGMTRAFMFRIQHEDGNVYGRGSAHGRYWHQSRPDNFLAFYRSDRKENTFYSEVEYDN